MSFLIEDAEGLRLIVAALSHVRNRDQLAALIERMATFEIVKFVGFSYWRGLGYDRPVDWSATTFPPEFHAVFGSSASMRRHQVASHSLTDLVPVDWFEVSAELGLDYPDIQGALVMGLTRTGLSCAARGHGRNYGILYINFNLPEDKWKSRRLSLAACVQLIAIYIHQKLLEVCPELGSPDVLSTRERACISLAA
ncbi:MAG: Transcriptional activator of quorum sensing CerR, partial [Hyphomicrobiales bacterium]|nr:Transcriptional activator of quorum sensing CerR [Hyphomicrobiales bacterium]